MKYHNAADDWKPFANTVAIVSNACLGIKSLAISISITIISYVTWLWNFHADAYYTIARAAMNMKIVSLFFPEK